MKMKIVQFENGKYGVLLEHFLGKKEIGLIETVVYAPVGDPLSRDVLIPF